MADSKHDSDKTAQQPAAEKSQTPTSEAKATDTSAKTAAEQQEKAGVDAKGKEETAKPDSQKKDNTSKPTAKHPTSSRKGGALAATLAVVALIGSAGAGGGVYWLWQQMQSQSQQTVHTVTTVRTEMENLQSAISNSQQALESTTTESVNKAIEQLAAASSRQEHNEQAQEALRASLEGLYARIGNTTRAWMMKEADYLLQIGNHRLQLERDLSTAAEALRLADSRINAIGEPALLKVREAIASEIASLETFPVPDRIAMSLSLAELANKVRQLPLMAKVQPEQLLSDKPEIGKLEAESWKDLPNAVWDAMKQLVVVRVNDRPIEALLPPEQVSFLYQNLQLKLEQARLALLQYNTELYRSNLQAAQEWIKNYYNIDASEVQSVITKLDSLAATDLSPTLPDISGSLRMLRNVASRIQLDSGKVSALDVKTPAVAALHGGK